MVGKEKESLKQLLEIIDPILEDGREQVLKHLRGLSADSQNSSV